MNIDAIKNGFVIDHIPAGSGMKLYDLLGLDALDCQIAIIKNAASSRMGKKDIIKIAENIPVDLDNIGYVAPNVTISVIRDGKLVEKKSIDLPEMITNVIQCKNPRCITSTEQELDHQFRLSDREKRIYRCIYCETKASYDD